MKEETQKFLMDKMLAYMKRNFVQRKDALPHRVFSADRDVHGFESAPYVSGVFVAHAFGVEKEIIMEYFDLIETEYDNTLAKAHGLVNNRIRKDLTGTTTLSKEPTITRTGAKHVPDGDVIDRRITNYIKILSNYVFLEVTPLLREYVNLEDYY